MRAIDGDALIEFVENSYDITWHHGYEGGIKDACIEIINEIGRMPTIERTGKWIDDEGNAATDKYCATCSACGEWSEYLTAYCPNCGAKME